VNPPAGSRDAGTTHRGHRAIACLGSTTYDDRSLRTPASGPFLSASPPPPQPKNHPLVEIPLWYWFAFGAFVITMLALDLSLVHRGSRETSTREAAFWTLFWCFLALLFSGLVWWLYGHNQLPGNGMRKAFEFINGYVVEWSLSMDNVFVFVVIFRHFRVPAKYQYRVLFWGILAAIFLRLAFVLVAAAVIHHFEWTLYLLGAFLIYTGVMVAIKDDELDPEQGLVLRLSRRWLPVAEGDHGDAFLVRQAGRWMITPLFLVLVVVNTTDIVFAVDSVPAIFGLTKDTFIIFTSNVFAIFGLRALYFLLISFMDKFHLLKYGLSAILIFVGAKMLLKYVLAEDNPLIANPFISLVIIILLLGASIAASLVIPPRDEPTTAGGQGIDGHV
jgi:TerC family integral membrane protein